MAKAATIDKKALQSASSSTHVLSQDEINAVSANNQAFNSTSQRAVTPPSTSTPIKRTISTPISDPGVAAAEGYLSAFKQPESAGQIAERKRKEAQGLIDSVKSTYDQELFETKQKGQERLSSRNALSVFSGTAGSPEANASREGVQTANSKEERAVQDRKILELQTIYSNISAAADKEAREQVNDATRSAEAIVARSKERQTQATEQLKAIAASGSVDFDAFKSSPQNEKVYNYALQAFGGSEDAVKGFFALNRPKDTVIASKWNGNTLFQVYRNPITGATKTEVVDLGALGYDIPKNYSKSIDLGGQVMLIPEDFDPSKDKPLYISKSLTPNQVQDGDGGGATGDPAVDAWVSQIQNGAAKITNVPAKLRNAVIMAMDTNGQGGSRAHDLTQQALDALTTLEGTAGKSGAVGAKGLSSFFGLKDKPMGGTAASGFLTQLDRTKALLTLPNLQYLKGLGAMSDREFNTIAASVAALSTDMPEAEFDKEVTRIKEVLSTTLNKAQNLGSSGDLRSAVTSAGYDYDALRADGHSDEEIKSSIGL